MDFVKKTYEKEESFKKGGENKKSSEKVSPRGTDFVFSKEKMNSGFIDYMQKHQINEKVGLLSPLEAKILETEYLS